MSLNRGIPKILKSPKPFKDTAEVTGVAETTEVVTEELVEQLPIQETLIVCSAPEDQVAPAEEQCIEEMIEVYTEELGEGVEAAAETTEVPKKKKRNKRRKKE